MSDNLYNIHRTGTLRSVRDVYEERGGRVVVQTVTHNGRQQKGVVAYVGKHVHTYTIDRIVNGYEVYRRTTP